MRLTAALLSSAMVGISAPLLAQKPTVPTGPISLIDAITIGRRQGVEAAIAQLNVRAAEARKGQRLADLLPNIEGQASYIRQTINLDAFGFPGVSGLTDAFNLYNVQLRASQSILDLSARTRYRAGQDTVAAAKLDARVVGDVAGANAGVAYLRVLSAEETVQARTADSMVAADLLRPITWPRK